MLIPRAKKGTVLIGLGLLLIAAALSLACYNIWDENRAVQTKNAVLSELAPIVETDKLVPDYKAFPDMEMPTEEIDGHLYIGVLEVPSLGLELPVMSDWSYPKLKIAPCRYEGSAYTGDLIIAAHNYDSHFGRLKSLLQGELITFTDVDGNEFLYEVADIEVLDPYAVEEMISGDWELTLFTCTYGGQERVAVRCLEVETQE